jgi:hypothetical protein
MHKSANRLEAERLMRTEDYWKRRDPDLMERVHELFRREPGGTTPVLKRSPPTMGGKGTKLT